MRQYLTPEQISDITKAPLENVRSNWPYICEALEALEINTSRVQVGMVATVAVETGSFNPVREIRSKRPGSAVYKAQQRYYSTGYYGRGFIQLTWKENYRDAGNALGVDLLKDPDLALNPDISAKIAAWFFKTRIVGGVDKRRLYVACDNSDWPALRRGVCGPGYMNDTAGYLRYTRICSALSGVISKSSKLVSDEASE